MSKLLLLIFCLHFSVFADESIPVEYEEEPAVADKCSPEYIEALNEELRLAAKQSIGIADTLLRGESCQYYKKFIKAGVPVNALKQSLYYFEKNKKSFKNKNYITIADYSVNSTKERFFLLDMRTGEVSSSKVSHGSGSLGGVKYGDATISNGRVTKSSNHNGMMKRCRIPKNKVGNKHDQYALTRPGFFKTGEFYMSSSHNEAKKGNRGWPTFRVNGRSYNGMRMDGLSDGVNDKARAQGVVMHEAYYNTGSVMGRSFGCPAFVPKQGRKIMEKIAGGSLYYSYVPIDGCKEDYNKALEPISKWSSMCE
ncbi:murein L,D-transpeptidase catalytic domain-containing protein [Halobacteriovorax marinus]|uniref:murein L,D-transpeptidase catalytic domain-containing protein n=1 Tax=Halobacteriovorax marinus TaxID=97084 RepID=UPI003A91277C